MADWSLRAERGPSWPDAAPLHPREIGVADYARWFEQHVTRLQGRSAFHQPGWLRVAEEASGQKLICIGLFKDGVLLAAVPAFLKRMGPFKFFGSPMRGTMTPCLGPIWLAEPSIQGGQVELAKVCSAFARLHWGASYAEFCFREPGSLPRESLDSSWEYRKLTTYYLDLSQGEQKLWNRLRTRCRRHVRKAQQLGMKIVPLNDPRGYYQMLNETFGRRGTSLLHSEEFFRLMLEKIPPAVLWAWGVEHEGNVIAAGIYIRDDHEVHYLSGASSSKFRTFPTSYLLHWHAIVKSIEAGLRIYDLGGRGPTENLDLFKKSFEPEIAEWSLLTKTGKHIRYARDMVVYSLPLMRKIKRWLPGS